MSIKLTQAAVQEFDDEVKHEFQQGGKLRECVTLRNNVRGSKYKFTRMGKGLATERIAPQADVTPMDITHGRQSVDLNDYEAAEYTDIFNQQEVNFDERQELAKTIALALSRRLDQQIIDALNAATYAASPSGPDQGGRVAAGGTQFTVAKLRAASRFLSDAGVPESERFIAYTAEDRENLLGETEATSSDFNTVKALANGEIDTFVGFKFKLIETRNEGGLPTNKSFAWHRSAVGAAIGIDMTTRIDWVAQKSSWLANGMLKSGAVVREAAGCVEINMA